MAVNDNPGSGGEDNYDDSPSNPPAEAPKEEGMDESPRGLLPKAILAGKDFKPGDEIVLKIDAIHDDEVEVSYAPEKGKEGGDAEMAEAPPPGEDGDSEMASMME